MFRCSVSFDLPEILTIWTVYGITNMWRIIRSRIVYQKGWSTDCVFPDSLLSQRCFTLFIHDVPTVWVVMMRELLLQSYVTRAIQLFMNWLISWKSILERHLKLACYSIYASALRYKKMNMSNRNISIDWKLIYTMQVSSIQYLSTLTGLNDEIQFKYFKNISFCINTDIMPTNEWTIINQMFR